MSHRCILLCRFRLFLLDETLTDLLCLSEGDDLLLAPPLAQKCTLASIHPVGGYKPSWTSQVMQCLRSAGASTVEGGAVSVLGMDSDNGTVLYLNTTGTGLVL